MIKRTNKSAFTLAEVLITLAIIGVVAAMTIPALMNSTNQQEFKTAFKKAVSVLNQAITMNIALDSADTNSRSTYTSSAVTEDQLMYYFSQRMNVIASSTTDHSITTADGIQYFFAKNGATCTATGGNVDTVGGGTGCFVLVDVNGVKKPNTLSTPGLIKDQFYVAVMSNSAIPAYDGLKGGHDVAQQIMYQN